MGIKQAQLAQNGLTKLVVCTANVLSAEFTDECLQTKSKDN